MTDNEQPTAPQPVAWQLTVDGVPLWNEASFYRTEADAKDAIAEGCGNGAVALYLGASLSAVARPAPLAEIVRQMRNLAASLRVDRFPNAAEDLDALANGVEANCGVAGQSDTETGT